MDDKSLIDENIDEIDDVDFTDYADALYEEDSDEIYIEEEEEDALNDFQLPDEDDDK